jgi:hypothetical protein
MCYYYYHYYYYFLNIILLLSLSSSSSSPSTFRKTFYLRKPQGFLSSLELSEMNSKYYTVTIFLSVSVINNISNQNLQQCFWLISIPNFEKRDSSRLLVFAITLQAEYRFYAVANFTTYRPTTASIEDAYFRRVIIIHNFRTRDASIAPNPQIVRLPRPYYAQTASDNGQWPT